MSKKTEVRIALIGAGRIGRVHAQHLKNRIDGATLVAIADSHQPSAQKLGQDLGIQNVYSSHREMFANEKLDAVLICSSTDTHAQIIEDAAANGLHIFCEKPIDHEVSKIDRALKAVEKAGVKLQIGFNRRFDPNFSHVQSVVKAGKIGEPHIIRITSRDPAPPPIEYIKVSGGIFMDMTIHDFDMARFLAGSEVTKVFAMGGVRVDPRIKDANDIDTAVITLEFENGAIATIDNSRQAVYGYDQRVEVFGSAGAISADNNTPHRTTLADKSGVHTPLPLNFFMDRYTESYLLEINQFVQAVFEGTDVPVTGEDGRMPVLMALAARQSLSEGKTIALSEIAAKISK
ncbi:MAG: inositol 2-dehydrogenase [Cyanobacteria bacterium SZAS-4]|nr:inositol 2-dehydrogenase [Cyanobacteria bacterium SZAS-4]